MTTTNPHHTNNSSSTTSNNNNSNNNNNHSRGHHHQHHHGPSSKTPIPSQPNTSKSNHGFHLGLYGWRKKCLYLLILGLTLLIIINLALTLWILKVMEFSPDGMGQLKVIPGGLQLSGQALILDLLRASTIRSRHNQPIALESSRNFTINTRDNDGYVENQLFLGHDKLECLANSFRILDTHGDVLFAADRDEITIGANSLRVEGEGGIIFKESIQTPLVRHDSGKEMKLESPTRTLDMRASQEIIIQSRAGSLDASCLNDIKLHSIAGSIRLESPSIIMPNLKVATPPSTISSSTSSSSSSSSSSLSSSATSQAATNDHGSMQHKIYQLCACSSGKLFLASSHSLCSIEDSNICR